MVEHCIFCKISKGEIFSKKIYENNNFFSISDSNPKVQGHSLIISKKHFYTTLDLPSGIGEDLLDCVKKTFLILAKKNSAEGFNLINNNFESGGQVVKHVHFHLLPRKNGDSVETFF